jgi:hypothetical protein
MSCALGVGLVWKISDMFSQRIGVKGSRATEKRRLASVLPPPAAIKSKTRLRKSKE